MQTLVNFSSSCNLETPTLIWHWLYISLEGPDTMFFLFAFSVRILQDGIQKTKGSTKEGVNIAGDSWQKVYVLVVYTSGVIGMKYNSCSGNQFQCLVICR